MTTRNNLCRKLGAEAGLGGMSHHFEDLKLPVKKPVSPRRKAMILGCILLAAWFAVTFVQAVSAKTARSCKLFIEIEATK